MGRLAKHDDEFVYQQDDGEITAWFTNFEEKLELPHEGTPAYKKIFFLLVGIGLIYLLAVFVFL
jgi:hypothetical protein